MKIASELKKELENNYYSSDLSRIYCIKEEKTEDYSRRFLNLIECFENNFGFVEKIVLFSSPGRTELGGNHTDHQHGCVLAVGAYRVHGGGFAGTVQAFVPIDMLKRFKEEIELILGKGRCHVLSIRPVGGLQVA